MSSCCWGRAPNEAVTTRNLVAVVDVEPLLLLPDEAAVIPGVWGRKVPDKVVALQPWTQPTKVAAASGLCSGGNLQLMVHITNVSLEDVALDGGWPMAVAAPLREGLTTAPPTWMSVGAFVQLRSGKKEVRKKNQNASEWPLNAERGAAGGVAMACLFDAAATTDAFDVRGPRVWIRSGRTFASFGPSPTDRSPQGGRVHGPRRERRGPVPPRGAQARNRRSLSEDVPGVGAHKGASPPALGPIKEPLSCTCRPGDLRSSLHKPMPSRRVSLAKCQARPS